MDNYDAPTTAKEAMEQIQSAVETLFDDPASSKARNMLDDGLHDLEFVLVGLQDELAALRRDVEALKLR